MNDINIDVKGCYSGSLARFPTFNDILKLLYGLFFMVIKHLYELLSCWLHGGRWCWLWGGGSDGACHSSAVGVP